MSDNNIKQKLIDLFACHNVEEIEAKNGEFLKKIFGDSSYPGLLADDTYQKYYEMLKGLRKNLNDALTEQEHLEQAKGCLQLLKEAKESPSKEYMEILSELIRKGVYDKWRKDAQEYYNTGRDMITIWKDFFLSYTNRNLPETNNDFKDTLCHVLGETYFKEKMEKVNCVARLIVHYLINQNNLIPFFDQDNLTCGDEINEEILENCRSVYAFVQLVEPVIFQAEENNQKNWCFFEFKTFDDWSSSNHLRNYKRYYFILTEKKETVFPASFPALYNDWKGCIESHLYINEFSSLNNKRVREKIQEIAVQIVKTKKQILQQYIE